MHKQLGCRVREARGVLMPELSAEPVQGPPILVCPLLSQVVLQDGPIVSVAVPNSKVPDLIIVGDQHTSPVGAFCQREGRLHLRRNVPQVGGWACLHMRMHAMAGVHAYACMRM